MELCVCLLLLSLQHTLCVGKNNGRKMKHRVLGYWMGASAAMLLAGCGGSSHNSAEDKLQPFRTQVLKWEACDAAKYPSFDGAPTTSRALTQCAMMSVPLDYAAPDFSKRIQVAVSRVSAAEPAKRRGSLFFNPGGPGADGLRMASLLWGAFATSNPKDPLGALQLRLLQEYDMIGFSPRGVGSSTRLKCESNTLAREMDFSAAAQQDPVNLANELYNVEQIALACKNNPLTASINTEATVQDMDLLRGLLGDEKLSYLGYSYGTWLGAWYASRFPNRVDRMVLDSAMDFTADGPQLVLNQPKARERIVDEVLEPYAARHVDYYNLGTSPGAVRAALTSLSPVIQNMVLGRMSGYLYSNTSMDLMLFQVLAAQGLDATLKSMPGASAEAVVAALQAKDFTPKNQANNTAIRATAVNLYKAVLADQADSSASTITDATAEAGGSVYWAVNCNDTPAVTDPQFWTTTARQQGAQYPLFASGPVLGGICAFWGGPSVTRPALSAMQGLDVLLVQSQYDGATANEGAQRSFDALPKARQIFVPGEFTHGVYPYETACVDTLVAQQLLGNAPSERLTSCNAKPLGQDAKLSKSASVSTTYVDPEAAAKLIDDFKQSIGRAPRSGSRP